MSTNQSFQFSCSTLGNRINIAHYFCTGRQEFLQHTFTRSLFISITFHIGYYNRFSYSRYLEPVNSGLMVLRNIQGPYSTGKTGEMVKIIPCQGKRREFGYFANTDGISFAQIVNSLILKIRDIAIFAEKLFQSQVHF